MSETADSSNIPKQPLSDERSRSSTMEFYVRLRRDIIRGHLAPGIKLRIEAISELYNVGPTPVREALSRLSAEGLVEKRELRGFAIAGISLADIRSLAKTRCWLEEIALRESLKKRTETWEEAVLLAFHRMSRVSRLESIEPPVPAPAADELHWSFHDALLSNCGSPSLLNYCRDLREKYERYRSLASSRIYQSARKPLDEHRAIMDSVLSNDANTAVSLLVSHYKTTLVQMESIFGKS